MRLAQSQPQLVADLLQRVRRLDAVLHHVARSLEKQTVVCDRAISIDRLDDDPVDPYPDTRTADLVRLAASAGPDAHVVIEAYATTVELSDEERLAAPLLDVALAFDQLAEVLVDWARRAPAPAPVVEVRAVIDAAQVRLDELGVPVEESGPPRRGRRG